MRGLVDVVVGVLSRCQARSRQGTSRASQAECKVGASRAAPTPPAGETTHTGGRPGGCGGGGGGRGRGREWGRGRGAFDCVLVSLNVTDAIDVFFCRVLRALSVLGL